MNKKFLKHYMETEPEGTAQKYIFLVDKQELGKILEQFILRFEREPKNDPELSWFHKFDSKGKVTGVRDMEIVDYIVENVSFFVRGEIPYYYEHGVFIEDTKGVKLKYRIQKLIYRDQVNSSTIQRVYNLLITQPQIYRNSYELNKQPAHWINFRNAYYDVLSGELIEHDPKYMTINQIPFPYYPEDREKVLEGGANIRKYLDSSIPDKIEQQMFWEYFGYRNNIYKLWKRRNRCSYPTGRDCEEKYRNPSKKCIV